MKRPGRAEIAMVLAAGAWFAIMAVYQVDDAYIVYRYATNLGRGDGFVFNPGEHVECRRLPLRASPGGHLPQGAWAPG